MTTHEKTRRLPEARSLSTLYLGMPEPEIVRLRSSYKVREDSWVMSEPWLDRESGVR